MIYPDEEGVALMGKDGFIGRALNRIQDLPPAVYFFDSPSSNILFDANLDMCMEKTIFDFLKVIQYCRDSKMLLVFPSSATVYNKNTSYARCKAILEEIAASYDIPYLGLRIAAGYGPGEYHKGKYASVVYQWCQQMKKGERPVIFGDGTQTRDFIYETDIAEIIVAMVKDGKRGIADVGTNINTSFNDVVTTINRVLGKDIKPIYVDKPLKYVPETKIQCGYRHKVSLEEGITNIIFQGFLPNK